MKEKMRALLLETPDITLPEAARALNANERNCKSVRVAYWQARALLMEELTGKTLRAILDEGPKDNVDEGHIDSMDHKDKDLISKNDISKNDNSDKDLIEELPKEFVYQGYKYWQGKSGAWRRRALTAPEDYWEDVERTKAESARAIFTLGL